MFFIPKMHAFTPVVYKVKCRPICFGNIFHYELAREEVLWIGFLGEGERLSSLKSSLDGVTDDSM